jgi:hypothetical protein
MGKIVSVLACAALLAGCSMIKGALPELGIGEKPVPVAVIEHEFGTTTVLSDGTTTSTIALPKPEPIRLSTKGGKKYKPTVEK